MVFVRRRVWDGIRVRWFGLVAALARCDLPLDRGLFPGGACPVALLACFETSDAFSLALLSGSLTFVGEDLALVGEILAVVGHLVAVIRQSVALIGNPLAPSDRALSLLKRQLTLIVQPGALMLQRHIPSSELIAFASDLRAVALDLSPGGVAGLLEPVLAQPL